MNDLPVHRFTITAEDLEEPCRVDVYVCDHCSLFSRSQLAKRNAQFFLSGKQVKPSKKVHPGDQITVTYTDLPAVDVEPQDIPLSVLYEDDHVLVINKEAGQVVHPGAGHHEKTVIQGVLYRQQEMLDRFPEGTLRPGIVHRLDMDTSGTMIIAKDQQTHEFLSRQFHDRRVHKVYIAVLRGDPGRREGKVSGKIGRHRYHRKQFTVLAGERGKPALTRFQVLRKFNGYSLVRLIPVTGRTHQLRVHMNYLRCPIVGDSIYGRSRSGEENSALLLHAFSLTLALPDGIRRTFRSPMPGRIKDFIASVDDSSPEGYRG